MTPAARRETSKAAQLYRHFDAAGRLFYVGISLNAVARLQQHAVHAAWFNEIARVEIRTYPSVERAQAAERWAIQTEAPLHNVQNAAGLPSNAEVGHALRYTLAEAYRFADHGALLNTIDPVEYASMSEAEKRLHRQALKHRANRATRAARQGACQSVSRDGAA